MNDDVAYYIARAEEHARSAEAQNNQVSATLAVAFATLAVAAARADAQEGTT